MELRESHPDVSLVSGFLKRHFEEGINISPLLDWAQRMSALGQGLGPQGKLAVKLEYIAELNKQTPEQVASRWKMSVDGPIAPVNIDPLAQTERRLPAEELEGLIRVEELGVPRRMLPVLIGQAHPDRRVRREQLGR